MIDTRERASAEMQEYLATQAQVRDDSQEDRLLVLDELRQLVMAMKRDRLRYGTLQVLGESAQAAQISERIEKTVGAVSALFEQFPWLQEEIKLDATTGS